MSNFSLLVRKKYNALDFEQKRMFTDEYNRRKKSVGTAYLLWVLGWHYAYLRKWGLCALFLFSLFGFFIWWIIDLFRIPALVNDYNNDLALDILRDITMMFGNTTPILENKIETENKENIEPQKVSYRRDYGNSIYSAANSKSDGEYRYILILVLFIAFLGVSAYTKPTKVKMENDIINKFLETQPQFLNFLKNVFLGEEITEEKADTLIYNFFKSNGYEIYFKDYDGVIVKRFEIAEQVSDKSLLVAYGFLGKTFIIYKAKDLVIDFNKNKPYHSDTSTSKPSEKIDYDQYKIIDNEANYKDAPNNYEKPVNEEKPKTKIPNLLKKKEGLEEMKNEPQEDSIKI